MIKKNSLTKKPALNISPIVFDAIKAAMTMAHICKESLTGRPLNVREKASFIIDQMCQPDMNFDLLCRSLYTIGVYTTFFFSIRYNTVIVDVNENPFGNMWSLSAMSRRRNIL